MHLHTRNINTAFRTMVEGLHLSDAKRGVSTVCFDTVRKPSRNGNVLMIDEPVLVTYDRPLERVLFNQARDANPFFMLYESMWMLAGRNDVAPVAYYAKQMNEYSDDGKTLNGGYGYRWRNGREFHYIEEEEAYLPERVDQLDILVMHLKTNPESRRAVLQMWNVSDDLLKIGCKTCDANDASLPCPTCGAYTSSPKVASRDVCCNLSVMFSIRKVNYQCMAGEPVDPSSAVSVLDMTVTNRSNDMVWGMLGANMVHFSFLQEYMAARLGVEVGKYHHFSNNLHVYDWNWKPDEWLKERVVDGYGYFEKCVSKGMRPMVHVPLVKDAAVFEKELHSFVGNAYGLGIVSTIGRMEFTEPFLETVAKPMACAFSQHKDKCPESAMDFAEQIKADDWRIACTNWLTRRAK